MTQSIADKIISLCMTREGCTFIHVILIYDVKLAVKKLKSGKSGRSSGIMSDCYVHGTELLYYYIALLFNCMLVSTWRSFRRFPCFNFGPHSQRIKSRCTKI